MARHRSETSDRNSWIMIAAGAAGGGAAIAIMEWLSAQFARRPTVAFLPRSGDRGSPAAPGFRLALAQHRAARLLAGGKLGRCLQAPDGPASRSR